MTEPYDAIEADNEQLRTRLNNVITHRDQLAAAIANVRKYIAGRQSAWPDDWAVVVPARHVIAALDAPQHTCPDGEPCPPHDETAQCPKPGPHAPHMWTWREEGVDCPGQRP